MPFSNEELTLFDAIHDDPRNDAPRLTYANWCGAHGLPDLAESIRLMCGEPIFDLSLSRMPPWRARLEPGFWEMKKRDPERVARAIELVGTFYGSERFPENRHYEYLRRGLPLLEISNERYPDLLNESELAAMPLARITLSLHCKAIGDWMAHPVMRRVDILRYHPEYDWDAEEQRSITGDDIRALLASSWVDRLTEFNLCGRLTDEASELARGQLASSVRLNYSY